MTRGRRLASAAIAVGTLLLVTAGAARANGLLTSEDPATGRAGSAIRLVAHRVKATVRDQVAEVVVEQVFHSDATALLEATYLFPLPDGAALHRFEMQVGDQTVGGEVIGADRARGIYEEIVRRRKDPGLLEYVGRGLFRARVFPVEPGKDLAVRIAFQELLTEDAGTIRFRYPLATDRFHGALVDEARIDVEVESTVDLKGIYSTSHAVQVRRDGDRKAHAGFSGAGRRQDRDFLLFLARSPEDVGFSVLSHRDAGEDGTFLAVVAPRAEGAARVAKDVVFVLDTSGSMAGKKIEQAAGALAYGIRTLAREDRFRVIAFASSVRAWREGWTEATTEAREAAATWLGSQPPEGGTNIEGALKSALSVPTADRPFYVVFVTDGLPTVGTTDPTALLASVRAANASSARIFTFGVGYDLDVALLDRIAETTRARRDYVTPDEDIEVATGRFFLKVGQPVLARVKVELGDGVHDVYPSEVGDLFAGEQVALLGRYGTSGPRTLRLRGRAGEREVVHSYATVLRDDAGVGALPRLWAQRKVAYLLDQVRLHGAAKEVVDEIVALATRHAIVTPYTAGIVVEDSARPMVREGPLADRGGTDQATEEVHATDLVLEEPALTDNDLPFQESFGAGEGGADAPFAGPAQNGLIGIGSGAGGAFKGRGGSRDLRTGGGGRRQSDDAAEHSLRWLAAHQSPDGRWESSGFDQWCDGKPTAEGRRPDGLAKTPHDVGVTGLALCAFLGAGYTNRGDHPFAKVVGRGLRWLKNVQDPEGCFGTRDSPRYLYDHAMAAVAMVEAYGMTESPIFKRPAQKALDFIALARNPSLAWGRDVKSGDNDTLLSGWMTLSLQSARLIDADAAVRGKPAPLQIDVEAFDGMRAWLDRPTGKDDPYAATAVDVLVRIFLGEDPKKSDRIRKGADRLLTRLPTWDPNDGGIDVSYWHYATLALFQVGGDHWKKWNEAMQTSMVAHQRLDTDPCLFKGSWDPIGAWGTDWGRVGTTSLLSMCLEVYYRYDRVLGSGHVAAATPDPATRVRDSEEIRDLQEDVTGTAREGADGLDRLRARVRRVDGKTFLLRPGGRWVDTAWDGTGEPERVEAFSDAWFRLSASSDAVRRYLAIADRVVFRHEGKLYETTPPPPSPPR